MTAQVPLRLSALVVAHNEEAQIGACLETLAFADEIVVVLDRCTDRTREIAGRFATQILDGSWEIEGDRRNVGLDACGGEWILEVDCDERVTDALAGEVRAAIATATDGYFLIPFDNYVGERLVRYGWGASWGVSAAPRLSRKGCKRWGRQRVHPSLTLRGPKGRLQQRMIHYVDRDISSMIQRLDRYTTARAADLRQSGDAGSLSRNLRRIVTRFFKCYVGRRGYREGRYGFLIALFAALYPILSYLKATLEDE